jgi:acetoin utilization protein AcuB
MSVTVVKEMMLEKRFRHMPIIDDDGNLVGILTQRMLLRALPSDVSGFSRFEVEYLLSKTRAKDVMLTDVKTIGEDIAIEEAARVMADQKIGCLPVCHEGELVGIITDSDLFRIMVELMGARRVGVRMTVLIQDRTGMIANLTSAIASGGGNMNVLWGYPGPESGTWISVAKVMNLDIKKLKGIISGLDDTRLLDIRETCD